MRTKPNKQKKASDHSHWPHNDLYRKFHREFDLLLQGDSPCFENENFDKCYVKTPYIEERLEYIIKSSTDSIQFLIGRTGIGKSTCVRHTFKAFRAPIVTKNTLTIPFSFNGMAITEQNYYLNITAIINAASKFLYTQYQIGIQNDNFVAFIDEHCPDVLMRGSIDVTKGNAEFLDTLKETDPFAYSLEQFKYFMHNSGVERVIILVDDIESESQVIQEKIIESMCRIYACLRNYRNRKAQVNLLFSVRPVTEKLARQNKSISAFAFSRPIIIKKPIPLSELFQVRMEYAVEKIGTEHIKNSDSWQDAHDILLQIAENVSDRFGYGMLRLFNNNIRRTLAEFQLIITNRTWLQRDQQPHASFRINMDDYAINKASVYRALGMRNGKVYPSQGTSLVNVFWNCPETTYDLLIIYVILFLLERNAGNEYLDDIVEKAELLECFKKLFSLDNYESVIERVLLKMEEMKLLEIEHREDNEYGHKPFLVIQPRAAQLWGLLHETSVTLELYRDDTYQEFDEKRDNTLSTSLPSDKLFEEIFAFHKEIATWEKRYLDNFKRNNPDYAHRIFGGIIISAHILSGIRKSLYAYYQDVQKDSPEMPEIMKIRLASAAKLSNSLKY